MKFIFIYLAVSQMLVLFGFLNVLNYARQYPKCETSAYPPKRKAVGWYTINLDDPPEERWKQIMIEKGFMIRKAIKEVKAFVREIALNSTIPIDVFEKLMPYIGDEISSPVKEEMQGIAKYGNCSYAEVVLLNLFYDLNPLCTSIVAQTKNGTLYHARNLDYGDVHFRGHTLNMSEALREGVINVRFVKKGNVSYVMSGYAGYAGVLTGMKPGAFTFSFNARHPDFGNVKRYFKMLEYIVGIRSVHWIAPLTRNLMENVTSYTDVLKTLEKDEMIAPVYYIVGGNKAGEGCILTKGTHLNDYLCLGGDRWYVLQTNYDHWEPVPSHDPRRDDGQHCMNETGQTKLGWPSLYNVLSTRPVLAPATTYTTLMQVNGAYETYVRYPQQPVPYSMMADNVL